MTAYPLLFRLAQTVQSENISARVVSEGRALMVREDGEWWCHGVQPGGLTEHAAEPPVAWAKFKTAYAGILDTMARQSKNYEAFEAAVKAFFNDVDRTETASWLASVEALRRGQSVDEPFSHLERQVAERPCSVSVEQLTDFASEEISVALAKAA